MIGQIEQAKWMPNNSKKTEKTLAYSLYSTVGISIPTSLLNTRAIHLIPCPRYPWQSCQFYLHSDQTSEISIYRIQLESPGWPSIVIKSKKEFSARNN